MVVVNSIDHDYWTCKLGCLSYLFFLFLVAVFPFYSY